MVPRTEAAVRAASTGSSSASGSAVVSSSRTCRVHRRMKRRARLHDLLHVRVGHRRGRDENRSVLPIDVDPVEHEHVHVGVEVQRGTEPLGEGYRAPTRPLRSSFPWSRLRPRTPWAAVQTPSPLLCTLIVGSDIGMAWEIPIDNSNTNTFPRKFIRQAQEVAQRRPHIPSYGFLRRTAHGAAPRPHNN